MLFAATTPFIEVRRLLNSAGLERYSKFSGINLLLCCIFTVLLRMIVPVSLIIKSLIHGSPLTMDVVVVAIYFLSAIFFGILNLWLVVTSVTAVFRFWHRQRTNKLERILGAGKPHGLEIEASDKCKFTTKRNDLNLMLPCSNANLAPQNVPNTNAQRCNIPVKSYHKMTLTEILNNPAAAIAISPHYMGHGTDAAAGASSTPGRNGGSGTNLNLIPPAVVARDTNTNVIQITDFDDDRRQSPAIITNNIQRSRVSTSSSSTSTASDVQSCHDPPRARVNNHTSRSHFVESPSSIEGARTRNSCHYPLVGEAGSPFSEGTLPKHCYNGGSIHDGERTLVANEESMPSTSIPTRSEHAPLTRIMRSSSGASDTSRSSDNIYDMQMAIMRQHVLDIQDTSSFESINGARHPVLDISADVEAGVS